jgi:hypothetical protein
MSNDPNSTLREEILKVGQKVDNLQTAQVAAREFLSQLHADHLRLEIRVKESEYKIQKNQGDLDKHIEVACVLQEAIRKDVKEAMETIKSHIAKDDAERAEILKYLRSKIDIQKQSTVTLLMWAGGSGLTIALTLFGMLWATGTVGS